MERNEMEWNGMEWNGDDRLCEMERNGTERNGVEWRGIASVEWNGMERNGVEWDRMECDKGSLSQVAAATFVGLWWRVSERAL